MSLSGILGLEVDHLGDDQVRDLVVHGRAEEDDALVQEPRVDVERALAARRLLDDHGDQRTHVLSASSLPGVQIFIPAPAFSFSGVQSFSRACASSTGIRRTCETTSSSAFLSLRSARSCSKPPRLTHHGTDPLRFLPHLCRLLPDQLVHFFVRDLRAELLCDRVENELALHGLRRLLSRRPTTASCGCPVIAR